MLLSGIHVNKVENNNRTDGRKIKHDLNDFPPVGVVLELKLVLHHLLDGAFELAVVAIDVVLGGVIDLDVR